MNQQKPINLSRFYIYEKNTAKNNALRNQGNSLLGVPVDGVLGNI